MIDSTNPRSMADNIRKLWDKISKISGDLLPSRSTATTGQILKLTGETKTPSWADEYTPPDYSTTETATGRKWIDGKDIYSKIFTFTTPSEAGSYTVGTISDLSALIDIEIIMTNSGTGSQNKQVSNVYGVTSAGAISYVVPSAFVDCSGFANVLYTKQPTPGRAPEDPEPEPEEKKTTKKKK